MEFFTDKMRFPFRAIVTTDAYCISSIQKGTEVEVIGHNNFDLFIVTAPPGYGWSPLSNNEWVSKFRSTYLYINPEYLEIVDSSIDKDLPKPGYHLREIQKGVPGELSKIKEEVEELDDALSQGSKIMMLVELSDLYGSIQLFLEKYFPGMTVSDLETMSNITQRAFRNGRR